MDDDVTDSGLAFEPDGDWEPDRVYSAAEALAPSSFDLDDGTSAAAKPEVGLSDHRMPDFDGLLMDVDGDRFRDELAKLKDNEAERKVRALLEKAARAMEEGRTADGWTLVRAALEIAPNDTPALLLGARCLHELGMFDAALDLLSTAREYVRDADDTALIVQLWDVAAAALTDEVGLRAKELARDDRGSAAVELVEKMAARYPEIKGLRYVHGAVLLDVGRLTEARDVVEAVLARGEAVDMDAVTELREMILFALCAPDVERARQSLRASRPGDAIDQLQACADVLQSNPRYEQMVCYAHQRCTEITGRRRGRRNATPLDAGELQNVLLWLLSTEIEAGEKALRGSDLNRVRRYCARAEAIDSRCGRIAYLHAAAEVSAAGVLLDRIDVSTLGTEAPQDCPERTVRRHLNAAAKFMPTVFADPDLTGKGNELADKLATDKHETARLTTLANCVARFNALTYRYNDWRVFPREELPQVRRSLLAIRTAANVPKREYALGSPARRVLSDLTSNIDVVLRKLPL